jgi:hypothetical protein
MLGTVEESARRLIAEYEVRAVFVAIDRLNQSIDRRNWHARDFWAQVVHVLHDYQRSGALPANPSLCLPSTSRPISKGGKKETGQ